MQKVVISPHPHQHLLCLLYLLVKKDIFFMFSSRSFIVSGLIFKFSIHLQLVFVSGIREESSLILLHMVIQFVQYHLLKRLSFPHLVFLAPLSYILYEHIYEGLFLGCGFCSIGLYVCFYASTILLSLFQLWNIPWNQKLWYLSFFYVSGLFWLFRGFQTNLRIFFLFL